MPRNGTMAKVRLSELLGQTVALKSAGYTTREISTTPDKTNPELEITRRILRADVLAFTKEGAFKKRVGETLVFQQLLEDQLSSNPDDWFVGVLTQEPHQNGAIDPVTGEPMTYYILEAVPDAVESNMVTTAAARGVRL